MKKHLNRQPLFYLALTGILFLAIAGVLEIPRSPALGSAELGIALLLLLCSLYLQKNHARNVSGYLKLITDQNNTMANDAISRLPLPMVILRIDGQILWYNDLFSVICEDADLYSIPISSLMPDLRWSEVLKSKDGIDMTVTYQDRHYHVLGNIIESNHITDENGQPVYSVLLYFLDQTDSDRLKIKYEDEKTDIAIINIDNCDELMQKMDDDVYQQTISAIGRCITQWVAESKGVIKKTERDRYLALFEHRYLKKYIKNKFDVLDKIRAIGEEIKFPVSISIGIGISGHIIENEAYARAALNLALGRGGDQAAIKDDIQYNFYGGKTKDYEKSTRVKTRAFAVALKDYIQHADKVIFMGHANADYDCFGAAIGLQRAVRSLHKAPYIVLDNSPAVKPLLDEVHSFPDYNGMIINNSTAMELLTEETLLIILDTHRPSMLPCRELLESANKVVLIDHHRRSTEFIENCSLTYHEPYASSTCEMATEILQYIDDNRTMTTFEAMALYVGILMDTKNFITKTGVRTFEAASYLRRYGLNTAEVKRLFNIDRNDYLHKIDIVHTTELFCENYAVAVCREAFPNIRVISSQAADDMLNISGVMAAFVIYRTDDSRISVSARSLGDVNVQIIMEKLGGGGHMTVAGAQLAEMSFEDAIDKLHIAIRDYINER